MVNKFFDNIMRASGKNFLVYISACVAIVMILAVVIAALIAYPIVVGTSLGLIFFVRLIYAGMTGK